MAAYFSSPRLKSAFTFQDLYVGLSPFDAPATLSMLPYTELVHGVWYPRGGMYAIVKTLVDLAREAGVQFSFGSAVSRVNTAAHEVRGVTLADGSHLKADVVLANADLPYVYRDLLPPSRTAKAVWRKQFSSSAISFFWGVDRRYDALGPHTLFLADDYRENFDHIVRDLTLPTNPSLYIHAPARLDPSMAPPAEDTLTAIVPVGHLKDGGVEDETGYRDRAREHVFRRLRTLGITDIEDHIKFEEVYTPVSWAERLNLAKGSTHGLSHKVTQMAYFRPSNRHRRYRNLYFAGASTHPGTGVPTAMVSGRLAAQRIKADLG
jgi:phytoene desaturase